jgi:alpha-tubulin suppressor-like RCC1 family protein
MSLSQQTLVASYTANGSTTVFPFPFKIFTSNQVSVAIDGVKQTTGFNIEFDSIVSGGSVIFNDAPMSGVTIRISRSTARVRTTDFVIASALDSDILDSDLDYLTAIAQESEDYSITLNDAGNWDANNARIINLSDPVDSNDSANKLYVDQTVTRLGNLSSPISGTDDGKWLKANAGAATWEAITNANVVSYLGYTPANKAGDTITGNFTVNGNVSSGGNLSITGTSTFTGSSTNNGTATFNNFVWANQGIITVNPSVGTNNNQMTTNFAMNRAVANGGYSKQIIKTAKCGLGGCIVINDKVFLSGLATAYIGKNGSQSHKKNFTEVPFRNPHQIPPGTTISEVTYSGMNLYVILSNGWVYSWGWNNYGQLGHADTTHRYVLTRIEFFVTNSLSVTNVWSKRWTYADDETYGYVFFKTSNGNTYSCGYNVYGNLGLGNTTSPITTPTRVTALQDVTMMSLSDSVGGHGLAVCSATPRSVYAWGYNNVGQCGNGTTTTITTPVITYTHSTDNIQQLEAVGSTFWNGSAWTTAVGRSYILVAGTIKSVGENTVGPALGIGNTTNQSSWQNVPTLTGITKIETNCGYNGSVYALNATTGILYACGMNAYGELGNGNTTNQSSFITSIASGCVDIRACGFSGFNWAIATLSDGRLVGCGYNAEGTLGLGLAAFTAANSTWTNIPCPRGTVIDFASITDLSSRHNGVTFVLMDDGGLYGCGANINNALSNNEETVGNFNDALTAVELIYK